MTPKPDHPIDEPAWNGLDGTTGEPLFHGGAEALLRRIHDDRRAGPELDDLRRWHKRWSQKHLDVGFGVDPRRLDQAGWGVVWPPEVRPEIRDALRPLLDHRRAQASAESDTRYRELTYLPGETKLRFLARHGAGPGPVDPDLVPYYLLLAGGPEEIPFPFQYQLDVQYAVGRIAFDAPEDYARYARSVVAAERGAAARPRRTLFFTVTNEGDRTTRRCRDFLVAPLARRIADRDGGFSLETIAGDAATKQALAGVLGNGDAPGLLFTASHGMGFGPDDPRQRRHLGALVCGDWPGHRAWRGPIPTAHYFSADDVPDSADVAGLVAFFFACFGAGAPREDGFERHRTGASRRRAPRARLAPLPQRLLSHPRGGALAVVGHVDRAWSYAFDWPGTGASVETFDSTLRRLFAGYPVGAAMEYFGQRHAELSTTLAMLLDEIEYGAEADPALLARLWTANNDARSYVVVGDPAVRLPGAATDREA